MRIFRLKGMEIAISPLFILLCLFDMVLGLQDTLWGLAALCFHEAGHVAVATYLGFTVSKIEFFPFGGQASIEGLNGENPGRETAVALAGPVASLFLAGLIYIMKGNLEKPGLTFFLYCNLLVGIINLLPALPLDGGRVLTALFSTKNGIYRATTLGARLGQLTALVLAALGIYLGLFAVTTVSGATNTLFVGKQLQIYSIKHI